MGPVSALTGRGDINVSYVSKELVAQAGAGNLDLQVIGARAEAKTGNGNISCTRAVQGVTAETQEGDITLMVVGASSATVKAGWGRISVGGARCNLLSSTDAGELHIKAVPHGDWQLRSASGTVRVELPPSAKFEGDALSNSGTISVERDDIPRPDNTHHLHAASNPVCRIPPERLASLALKWTPSKRNIACGCQCRPRIGLLLGYLVCQRTQAAPETPSAAQPQQELAAPDALPRALPQRSAKHHWEEITSPGSSKRFMPNIWFTGRFSFRA
jgi:hypothetical protein